MRKLFLFIPFLALTLLVSFVVAKESKPHCSYESYWQQVDSLQQQDLPKSAMQIVGKIQQKAERENAHEQWIRCLMYELKLQVGLDHDVFFAQVEKIENYTATCDNPVIQSVLYSLLAQLYEAYYNANAYTMNARTPIWDYVPESKKEWASNHFLQKISDYLALSVKNKTLLQQTSIHYYPELIRQATDSILRPTVYDVLADAYIQVYIRQLDNMQRLVSQEKIDASVILLDLESYSKVLFLQNRWQAWHSIAGMYQNLLLFHAQEGNVDALLKADIDRVEALYGLLSRESEIYKDDYTLLLDSMIKSNKENPLSVHIVALKAQLLVADNNRKEAFDLCQSYIQQFPTYNRIAVLQNIVHTIQTPIIRTESASVLYPETPLNIDLNYVNVDTVIVRLYATKLSAMAYKVAMENENSPMIERTLLQTTQFVLPLSSTFTPQDTLLSIILPNAMGMFEYEIDVPNKQIETTKHSGVAVTRLMLVHKSSNSTIDAWVVDRISGKPVPKATVAIYENVYQSTKHTVKQVASAQTDAYGLASISMNENKSYSIAVTHNDDMASPIANLWGQGNNRPQRSSDTYDSEVSLFTDRAIYRPKQIVYVKGIAWKKSSTESVVEKNKKIQVRLRDANFQVVAEKEYTTNEFGSFSSEFVLPPTGLTGRFTIEANSFSQQFLVEEYKRPNFELEIKRTDKEYTFGDTVLLKGKALTYMGFPLQQAQGKYRIVKQTYHWFRCFPSQYVEEIASGSMLVNDKGEFEISYQPSATLDKKNAFYHYVVYVDITDKGGETQQASSSFSIGEKAIFIQPAIPVIIQKEKLTSLRIDINNVNGELLQQSGKFSLYSLQEKEEFDIPVDSLSVLKKILEGSFESGEVFTLENLEELPSGRYKLVASALTSSNEEVENMHYFTLFSENDKRPPFPTYYWVYTLTDTCAIGEMARVMISTSSSNAMLMYELVSEKGLHCRRFIELNGKNKVIEIPFSQKCGSEIEARFVFVKDGNEFRSSHRIYQRKPSPKLTIQYTSFRDKLQPSAQEEWTLKVKNADSIPHQSEILVAMYDASLDAITNHQWFFNPIARNYWYYSPWRSVRSYPQSNYAAGVFPYQEEKAFEYPLLNFFGFEYPSYNRYPIMYRSVGGSMQKNAIQSDAEVESESMVAEEDTEVDSSITKTIQIRQNFAETAFFYPAIRTNEKGEASIRFTVPETLTKWKIMTLVHTPDLKFGQRTDYVQTQKAVSIIPTLPRFVYQKDSIQLTATVYNMLDSAMQVSANWEIKDALTDSILLTRSEQIYLQNKQSSVVYLPFSIPQKGEMLIVKVSVVGTDYSDGEQHYLPVLSSKTLVTETMPMSMSEEKNYIFDFTKLKGNKSPSLEHKRFVVEFSPNTAWYALQALPAISEPDQDNVLSCMSSYYANVLGSFVVDNTPEFKKCLQQPREKSISSLYKNEELKQLLAAEMPWLQFADVETEDIAKLTSFLDKNQRTYKQQEYWAKIENLQLPSGGFAWFAGMRENTMSTLFILEKVAKLVQVGALDKQMLENQLINKAVSYLDVQILDSYRRSQATKTDKNAVDVNTLHALFVRSCYPSISQSDDLKKANTFFVKQLFSQWKQFPLYDKSLVARILHRNNYTTEARRILTSLLENLTENEQMGLFWANNTAGYRWNQLPIATHAALMETIAEIAPNKEVEDKLKIWLLKNKQTNAWSNPIATVDAVYALLFTGNNMLVSPVSLSVKVNKQAVQSNNAQQGVGYVKQSYIGSEVTPSLSLIEVEKTGKGLSWGAAYWQYLEEMSLLSKPQFSNLNIDKKLFVERMQNNKRVLVPIKNQTLQVGDKIIVRLTLKADRDMDFVHIKDNRAGGLEPIDQISAYRYSEQLGYYFNPKDTHVNFFFEQLPKGTYVFEYPLWVRFQGDFHGGISQVECLYAPEFQSHSISQSITVKE